MRNRYLVSYDIADPKRLTKVHKTLDGFGEWVQLSVFICDLTPQRRLELTIVLTMLMNERQDRVMITDLGPTDGRAESAVTWMGLGPRIGKPPIAVVV